MDTNQVIRVAWTFLFIIYTTGYFYYGDLVHYTWWSLLTFTLYAFAGILQSEYHFVYIVLPIQGMVFLGVNVMSIQRCSLLYSTMSDVGVGTYAFGNFLYHHVTIWWILLLTHFRPRAIEKILLDITISWALMIIYIYYYNPVLVYDCPHISKPFVVGGVSGTYLCLILIIIYLSQ